MTHSKFIFNMTSSGQASKNAKTSSCWEMFVGSRRRACPRKKREDCFIPRNNNEKDEIDRVVKEQLKIKECLWKQ